MNPIKNEMIVELGEVKILLRPTFDNMSAMENVVGSINWLAYRATANLNDARGKLALKATELSQIIFFNQAADPKERLSAEEIYELVCDAGAFKVQGIVVKFLHRMTMGNDKAPELSERQKKS